LPRGALSHDLKAALRALLPLPAVPAFYRIAERWPKESLERRAVLMAARQES
jgi:hypothetical protein